MHWRCTTSAVIEENDGFLGEDESVNKTKTCGYTRAAHDNTAAAPVCTFAGPGGLPG